MTIDKLIEEAKNENWDLIDQQIPKIANEKDYVEWAKIGLDNSDGNVRDFATSIFGKYYNGSIEDIEEKLYHLMKTDENPYVRFRSAFALAYHNSKKDIDKIREVLKEAFLDEDVSEIAKECLEKL